MKVIVVNNPAATNSGALTVLMEFLGKISTLKCETQFICFVSLEELKKYESEKIKIIVLNKQSFKERIYWDNYGLKIYLKKEKIVPNLFISLQNTGVNLEKKIPQIIYYHQLLSLSKNKWNFFNKEERTYWKYEKIYPFFIKQYINRAKYIIVQTEWIKRIFSEKFKFPLKNIIVEKLNLDLSDIKKIKKDKKNKITIFYPATPLIYKNHEVILKALGELKKENIDILKNIECIFTFSIGESLRLESLINEYNLNSEIKLIGQVSYDKVLYHYRNSDLLVFPSYIETLGLPLLEAKYFNLEILTVDLEYARVTIDKYSKVKYLEYNNVLKWKEELKKYINERKNEKNNILWK